MAMRERWRLRNGGGGIANRSAEKIDLFAAESRASSELVMRISTESPRLRDGRMLALAFATAISDDPRVDGVWVAQTVTETAVTVVTNTLDDELEFRLRDIFEALAAQSPDPSIGYLSVFNAPDGLPPDALEGDQILGVA